MRWFTNYHGRRLEWMLALYTILLGGVLLAPFTVMAPDRFASALLAMSERSWGAVYAVIGGGHALALHINGRAWWTPFIRAGALFCSSQAFLALALSLAHRNPTDLGVFSYGFTAIGFCGAALASAAIDCGHEYRIWRQKDDL